MITCVKNLRVPTNAGGKDCEKNSTFCLKKSKTSQ